MKPRNTWSLYLASCVALIVVSFIIALDAYDFPFYPLIRGTAMLGYVAVFTTSLSSFFMRELSQYFGRPFIRTHHIVAGAALVILVAHATFNVLYAETFTVLLPQFGSLLEFFRMGGPVAFLLVICAVVAALLRVSIGKHWRLMHWLNYCAFILATIHGLLIGSDFRYLVIRIVALVMVGTLLAVFVLKRIKINSIVHVCLVL